tara:strand:+ start:220 stop:402 length:183 start_codon:yes stop_codon:yes gene_type:complete
MKSFVFKDLNFFLDGHDKAIICTLIKTDNKFYISSLNRATEVGSEVGLILLIVAKFKEIV